MVTPRARSSQHKEKQNEDNISPSEFGQHVSGLYPRTVRKRQVGGDTSLPPPSSLSVSKNMLYNTVFSEKFLGAPSCTYWSEKKKSPR